VNVLFTLAVIAVVGAWALAVYRRVAALRAQVKLAWKRLEAEQSNEAIKTTTSRYNARSKRFAYLIAPMTG
jgi:hypothetical protein